jgi:integrase
MPPDPPTRAAYAEKLNGYFRARYQRADGKLDSVRDTAGKVVHFRTKRDAQNAAEDAEAKVRAGTWRAPVTSAVTFGEYVNRWYARLDLAASTMQLYRQYIELHLLPAFHGTAVARITTDEVSRWEQAQHADGYAMSTVKSRRTLLHLILADAVADGLCEVNPAARRRGRGKRAGRSKNRGPEKVVTDAVGVLLVAERAALLAGRDDEFVAVVGMGFTGVRFGETVGLETEYVRPDAIRIEWQLYELNDGRLIRCPPKDDSYRTIDVPPWLAGLVREHITRNQPRPCPCHGFTYVFRAHSAANGAIRTSGPRLIDVARRAGVSTTTVSTVLNRPEAVAGATRAGVLAAITELGYIRGFQTGELAPHWRRSGFSTWLFRPAVTGRYPGKAPNPAHPVPVLGEPWPGVPVRGRNATGRADSCWVPIATGLTPHGLRHAHRTLLEELGIPGKLIDERMGHADGSVQARYTHITARMRGRLVDALTEVWEAALAERRKISPGSPVSVLDRLLRPGGAGQRSAQRQDHSKSTP